MNSELQITAGKGFHLTFKNGYTISVQFGPGNYCENENHFVAIDADCASSNAEIAVWSSTDEMITLANDQVEGWLSADNVARAISYVQKGQIAALRRMCRSHR